MFQKKNVAIEKYFGRKIKKNAEFKTYLRREMMNLKHICKNVGFEGFSIISEPFLIFIRCRDLK